MNSASTSPPSVSASAPQPSLLGSTSQRSPQQQHQQQHLLPPPHTYPHPSIVPLLRPAPGSPSNGSSSSNNGGVNGNGRLPQIHSWLDAPEGSGGGANGSASRTPPETHAHHPYAHAHAARRHTLPSGVRERSPP